jgi:hypothetical protein
LLLEQGRRNVQKLGELDNVLGRGLGLAIEESGSGDLIPADMLGDLLEAQLLVRLGLEKGLRGGREIRMLRDLILMSIYRGIGVDLEFYLTSRVARDMVTVDTQEDTRYLD